MKTVPVRLSQVIVGAVSILTVALASAASAENKSAPPAAPSAASPSASANGEASRKTKTPDVVYVPTPQAVVDKMLELAEVKAGDVVYDLGCGDGRIVVTAAKKFGVRAVGFDIDPQRVKEARENVRTNGVEHLVRIEETDIFTLDLREASVITLYLLPALNVRLMPQLARMKPGSRIVSHNFDMQGAKPVKVELVRLTPGETADALDDEDTDHTVYKWVVPWEPEPAAKAK